MKTYAGTAHLKKGRPTPPAPQHMNRRLNLFLTHPAFYTKEKIMSEIQRATLSRPSLLKVKLAEMQARQKQSEMELYGDMGHESSTSQPKPFLHRIMAKIRKASQRGN